MLTIHCYVCGADESLPGIVGTPSSPLIKFTQLHPHAQGSGRCRLTCPCGSVHEIVQDPTDDGLDRKGVETSIKWHREHAAHMKAADNEAAEWIDW